ncbi:GspH/FimT family protein [Motiliproteus sp. MSK22-1]|uniref:GspH/FimT family pseudopilin n=1 Tax=Motiliproteus sp. MSK22-1 TaxID=1897630 RepID=UPI000979FCB4|nr:GspH/FimT family protein [Motiliproteus sp. MSK22-1]OMH28399.1 hypothetical protein BGP75_21095 [Motiliproteus sp. MSK22-1]
MRKDAFVRCWSAPEFLPLAFKQSGLTLVELVVTLVLAIILSTLGVQSFEHLFGQSLADSSIYSLRTALALARSEAVSRNASVVLCRQGDLHQNCAGSSARGRPDWSRGWLLFVDVDRDKILDTSKGDQILREFPALNTSVVLRWNRGDYVAYQESGRLHSLNGTFCLRNGSGSTDHLRELKIPYTGRVRITSGECSFTW